MGGVLLAGLALATPARADDAKVRISRQPGFVYLPAVLAEQQRRGARTSVALIAAGIVLLVRSGLAEQG